MSRKSRGDFVGLENIRPMIDMAAGRVEQVRKGAMGQLITVIFVKRLADEDAERFPGRFDFCS
jgi:hypothetical protein